MRVLVVEDEPDLLNALGTALRDEGYAVDLAGTGEDGLEKSMDWDYDAIILDVMLPDVSGYEICQDVRLDPTLSDVKILLMTARGSAIERRKGLALGADGFIS